MRLIFPLTPWPLLNVLLVPVVWPLSLALALLTGLFLSVSLPFFLLLALIDLIRKDPDA